MILSMTGFSKKTFQETLGNIEWEIRSVNQRFLDIYFRLPEGFRELETQLKEIARLYLTRGKVEVSLRITNTTQAPKFSLNHALVENLQNVIFELSTKMPTAEAVNLSTLLQWPGLVIADTPSQEIWYDFLLKSFEETLKDLKATRAREGMSLKNNIEERLIQIETQVRHLHEILPEIMQLSQDKIKQRYQELLIPLEPQRVEQEIVLALSRMDVSEEMDRMMAHVKEVRRILNAENSAGRRLDFLMQELTREANTLGSKSSHVETSKASVELKVLIEQMREQIQNIE